MLNVGLAAVEGEGSAGDESADRAVLFLLALPPSLRARDEAAEASKLEDEDYVGDGEPA